MYFKNLLFENRLFSGTFAKTKFGNALYYSEMTGFGDNS